MNELRVSRVPSKQLENFLQLDGASQTGTVFQIPEGLLSFQATANAAPVQAFTVTAKLYVSNDGTNFLPTAPITLTLSGTGATPDIDGETAEVPWAYGRWDVTNLTGAGGFCTITMGH